MSIFVIGMNHKTAPLYLREQVYFSFDKLEVYLQELLQQGYAAEAVLLSTCNRSELYCDTNDIGAIRDWFCTQAKVEEEALAASLYIYQDEEAIAHIMKVACGLDSMVLGEPQILGQMKEAYTESSSAGTVGVLFHQLFQQIFSVAKEIRTTTAIGACPVSVVSSALHFLKQKMGSINNCNIVLIGAGDTTELLIRYLHGQVEKPLTIMNRSVEKARTLLKDLGGYALGLDALIETIQKADIVITATGSAIPILNTSNISKVFKERKEPILFLDLAVPRDIDPEVASIRGVTLYCIDDLKMIIDHNLKGREHAAEKAHELILNKSKALLRELASFDKIAYTIRIYRSQIEALCRSELLKAKQQIHQGKEATEVLETFAYTFTQKLLHAPSVQLRQAGAEGRFELLNFAKQLFAMPDSL